MVVFSQLTKSLPRNSQILPVALLTLQKNMTMIWMTMTLETTPSTTIPWTFPPQYSTIMIPLSIPTQWQFIVSQPLSRPHIPTRRLTNPSRLPIISTPSFLQQTQSPSIPPTNLHTCIMSPILTPMPGITTLPFYIALRIPIPIPLNFNGGLRKSSTLALQAVARCRPPLSPPVSLMLSFMY